jgi:hypothetical protein
MLGIIDGNPPLSETIILNSLCSRFQQNINAFQESIHKLFTLLAVLCII